MNIEMLLYESEGSSVDFKCESYRFENVEDKEKAELLKDILAFANAWRRETAYIITGAIDGKGNRAEIVGIEMDCDDSRFQQFINSKINRPMEFRYFQTTVDSKKIGVFEIPIQKRPFYLEKDYGGLSKNTVFIRRGSATAIASPDEIALMGMENEENEISVDIGFWNSENDTAIGDRVPLLCTLYDNVDKETIQLYRQNDQYDAWGMYRIGALMDRTNEQFFREAYMYIKFTDMYKRMCLYIKNLGKNSLKNMRIRATLDIIEINATASEPKMPSKVKPLYSGYIKNIQNAEQKRVEVEIETNKDKGKTEIEIRIIDVLPGETLLVDGIFFGSKKAGPKSIALNVYGDNIPAPMGKNLLIDVIVESRSDLLEKVYKF